VNHVNDEVVAAVGRAEMVKADWVKPGAILELFDNSPKKYVEFVASMDEDDEETTR
jgi:5,10-methylene-tetrahydrofolate dehydrogenase/methenyl tetrahydrofolate cyclohydrolase